MPKSKTELLISRGHNVTTSSNVGEQKGKPVTGIVTDKNYSECWWRKGLIKEEADHITNLSVHRVLKASLGDNKKNVTSDDGDHVGRCRQ
jgi:hypothetical protein